MRCTYIVEAVKHIGETPTQTLEIAKENFLREI